MNTTQSTTVQDARHVPLTGVDRLRQDAAQAAQVRALTTHPDVVALRTERVRTQVDTLIWVGLLLGLAFTMVNVQTFAAQGAVVGSLPWCAAWLLDPMVSLVLVAVLRAEQVTARYQVQTGPWVRRTKVFAFAATYAMNTWQSWQALHPAGIVLHSVPPVLVYCAAETGPVLRDRLTEAVSRAATMATTATTVPLVEPTPPITTTATEPVRKPRPATRTTSTRSQSARSTAGRKFLADYVADARRHLTPGTEITPAWVREVLPDCARGTSKNVADALNTERATTPTANTQTTEITTEITDLQGRAA
jgi:hypothetical protein